MSDHDQPQLPPIKMVERFCIYCRKYFKYFEGLEERHEEHLRIERRIVEYVGETRVWG